MRGWGSDKTTNDRVCALARIINYVLLYVLVFKLVMKQGNKRLLRPTSYRESRNWLKGPFLELMEYLQLNWGGNPEGFRIENH